jgi:hypothetical protein
MSLSKADSVFSLAARVSDHGLDDLIVHGIGEPLRILAEIFGKMSVEIGGVKVVSPDEDSSIDFGCRLESVLNFAESISEKTGEEIGIATLKLLALDGWFWSEHSFKSPVWMNDYREMAITDARRIKGLEWLKGSSQEILLKRSME